MTYCGPKRLPEHQYVAAHAVSNLGLISSRFFYTFREYGHL